MSDEYAEYGVTFEGPGGLDGGAVIDECGNFGVTGQSSPNFLAFNTGGTFENGGTPQGPQTIRFDPAVTVVQINGGVADFLMECYNDDVLVGSDTLPFSSTMGTMSVVAAAIDRCVFTWPQSTAVLDDLAFDGDFVGIDADEGLPVPTLGPVGLGILALLMLAVFGLRRRLV